ncbi:MAG: NAD(+) synthase [Bacteroidales bacterium]|nr:NAD(+) synthase [Bacteroidales bacterium]
MIRPDNTYFPFLAGEETMRNLAEGIRERMYNYVSTSKLQSLVLGISGGIDSTLCAALLRPVCDRLNIPLIGRSITIETNKADEIARSIAVGEAFCHDFEHLDITETFYANKKLLVRFDDSQLSKLRQGNMKARMRMMVLFDLAQLNRGMVISTDNYTEYLTGFWTLHGDVGDYAPVQHLWKTEIYNLATYLLGEENEQQKAAMQSSIDATPVDGLGISSCDCEQLGVENYFEADRIFAAYFQGDESLREHTLIKRYYSSEYKRHNPACLTREDLVKDNKQ